MNTGFSAARCVLSGVLALLLALAVWLPCVHFFFKPDLREYRTAHGLPEKAAELAARQLELWSNPELRAREVEKMRNSNAEWDFMGRTYLVLALANMGFRNPSARAQYLDIMDLIIDETIRLEKEKGIYYFLMDYARDSAFVASARRSLFQDGEVALMIAVRRLLEEKEEYKPLLAERVNLMVEYMSESPVLSGESYPDECWTFCNTIALATMRIADVLDGTDHSEFIREWVALARRRLVHADTGLLVSSYSFRGCPFDGPEGSTIWMVAHCLQVVDPAFADDQYRRAKKEIAGSFLGFGYAREWPESWEGMMDVDSGPIVPGLKISAGSSGLAILGAAAFGDDAYLGELITSLHFGGFPVERNGRLKYCASNQVGDAVLLYSMVLGPVWQEVRDRAEGKVVP